MPTTKERERVMRYTAEDINKFREYVSQASDYVQDVDDDGLYENLDKVLDFLVYVLDTFYPMEEAVNV